MVNTKCIISTTECSRFWSLISTFEWIKWLSSPFQNSVTEHSAMGKHTYKTTFIWTIVPFVSDIQKLENKFPFNQIVSFYIWKWKCLSPVQLFATPGTVVCQAPLSIGIFQTRILEWVAISFSRGSSQPRDQTRVSCIAGTLLTGLSHDGSLICFTVFPSFPHPLPPPAPWVNAGVFNNALGPIFSVKLVDSGDKVATL